MVTALTWQAATLGLFTIDNCIFEYKFSHAFEQSPVYLLALTVDGLDPQSPQHLVTTLVHL